MTTAPSSPRVRVLLVDDEEDLVEFMAQRLVRRGFTVAATTSGVAALREVERQTFDVAVVDLKMPQMDGVEVLQRIKAIQPTIEVVMLTGHGSTDSALAAGKLDAFRYLHKPYEYDALVAVVQDAWRKRRQELAARYHAELAELHERSPSAREILEATARLRREYEQD